ncbi:MAG: M4 family metallopeptidase, partial [Nocardioidaceae bacterium]
MTYAPRCSFIPPYLLHRIASEHVDASIARCGHATLAVDESLRSRRLTPPPAVGETEHAFVVAEEDAWTVHTANNGTSLPGTPVRSEGEPRSGDLAVDEAYAGIEASVALFAEEYRRDSYDGRGAPVVATVHYERSYDNAFWDGRQLVFGDGDGRVFDRFTKPVDVLAHEFVHAVTQYAAGFSYQGQSGALNESMSDVFAACVKQRVLG